MSMPHAAQTACKSEIVTKMKRSRDTDRDPGPGDWLAGRDLTLNNVNISTAIDRHKHPSLCQTHSLLRR